MMKGGVFAMRQPVLLCYNLKDESFRKVRLAAMRFKIRVRPVAPSEYGETLAALCGMEPPAGLPAPGAFADEMLVMAHLSSLQASQFLQSLRRLGVPPIALKAMLTPTNCAWNSLMLHNEISSEHAALEAGKQAVHSVAGTSAET